MKQLKPEIKEDNDEEAIEDNFEERVFEYDTKSCCLKLKEKCTNYSNQVKTKFQNMTWQDILNHLAKKLGKLNDRF